MKIRNDENCLCAGGSLRRGFLGNMEGIKNMETSRNFSFPVEGTNHVSWTLHDRGRWQTDGDILTIAGGWASLDGLSLENVSLEFDARCPESEAQVQIWAGLRHYS